MVSLPSTGSFRPLCLSHTSQRTSETESTALDGVTYAFGFGTGLLAAAAVSCCSTLEQFLPVALEAVLIGFRTGLLAAETRDQIVIGRTDLTSWRIRIETVKPEEVLSQLDELCTEKVGPS